MAVRLNGGVGRYGLPGMFVGVALSWWLGNPGPAAVAQTRAGLETSIPSGAGMRGPGAGRVQPDRPLAGGEGNGTLAMVTSQGGTAQWLYLVDTKSKAFAVYRVDPMNPKGALKLEAARQYQWDLKLDHYNNQAPEPAAVEATVKTLGQSVRSSGDR